jgi:hypothetical protein
MMGVVGGRLSWLSFVAGVFDVVVCCWPLCVVFVLRLCRRRSSVCCPSPCLSVVSCHVAVVCDSSPGGDEGLLCAQTI